MERRNPERGQLRHFVQEIDCHFVVYELLLARNWMRSSMKRIETHCCALFEFENQSLSRCGPSIELSQSWSVWNDLNRLNERPQLDANQNEALSKLFRRLLIASHKKKSSRKIGDKKNDKRIIGIVWSSMQSRHQIQIRVHLTFHPMDDLGRLAWAMTQIVTNANECQRTQTVSCCHCASVWPVSKVNSIQSIRYVFCLSFRKIESASNARFTKAIVDQMIFNSGRPFDGVFVYSKRFGGSRSDRQTHGRRDECNSLVTYERMN